MVDLLVGLALVLLGAGTVWVSWAGSQRRLGRRGVHAAGPLGVGGGAACACGLGVVFGGLDAIGLGLVAIGVGAVVVSAALGGVLALRAERRDDTDDSDEGSAPPEDAVDA